MDVHYINEAKKKKGLAPLQYGYFYVLVELK